MQYTNILLYIVKLIFEPNQQLMYNNKYSKKEFSWKLKYVWMVGAQCVHGKYSLGTTLPLIKYIGFSHPS